MKLHVVGCVTLLCELLVLALLKQELGADSDEYGRCVLLVLVIAVCVVLFPCWRKKL